MKTKIIIAAVLTSLVFAACGKENEIGAPAQLPLDVNIPQGLAPAAVDQRIVDFYNKYDTYLIYDYTDKDVAWKLVGTAASLSAYNMPKSDPAKVDGQLDLLYKLFMDFYPDAFLKKYLPYKIFLADQMLFRSNTTLPWNEWGSYAVGTNLVFGLGGRSDYQMPADSMYWAFNFINRDLITCLNNSSKLTYPDEFFNITDYTVGLTAPTPPDQSTTYIFPDECRFRSITAPENEHLMRGVFANMNAAQAVSAKQATDVNNFLTYMRYFPKNSPQWTYYLSFPLVKAKYDILVAYWITTYGYNPHSLGEADFGQIVIP